MQILDNKLVRGAGIGAVIGAIAAIAMGNKSIINYALVGAVLGTAAGFAMNKK